MSFNVVFMRVRMSFGGFCPPKKNETRVDRRVAIGWGMGLTQTSTNRNPTTKKNEVIWHYLKFQFSLNMKLISDLFLIKERLILKISKKTIKQLLFVGAFRSTLADVVLEIKK